MNRIFLHAHFKSEFSKSSKGFFLFPMRQIDKIRWHHSKKTLVRSVMHNIQLFFTPKYNISNKVTVIYAFEAILRYPGFDWLESQRKHKTFCHSFDWKHTWAFLRVHCLDAAGECVNVLCMTGPNRKPRRRSQARPDSRRSGPGPWWRLASGTVCLLSELYILRIMSERSQHKGEVNNPRRRSAG